MSPRITLNSEMIQYRYNLLNKLNPKRRFLFTTKFGENLRTECSCSAIITWNLFSSCCLVFKKFDLYSLKRNCVDLKLC